MNPTKAIQRTPTASLCGEAILVLVQIIDQRIGRCPAGLFGSFDRGVGARKDRIDGAVVHAGQIFDVVAIIPPPRPRRSRPPPE